MSTAQTTVRPPKTSQTLPTIAEINELAFFVAPERILEGRRPSSISIRVSR
jgi:hypothetical protein